MQHVKTNMYNNIHVYRRIIIIHSVQNHMYLKIHELNLDEKKSQKYQILFILIILLFSLL